MKIVKPLFRLCVFCIVSWVGTTVADDWRAASAEEIRVALVERSLVFGLARQTFYESGRTLYDAGRPSWGRWRVQGDRYCSLWPPQGTWACYDIDLHSDGERVRFTGRGDDVSIGRYSD